MDEILVDFGIDRQKVSAITSDRAANMLAMVALMGIPHVPCFAHAINTVVQKLLGHNQVSTVIKKMRSLYNVFAHSANANRALNQVQIEKQLPQNQMPSSCETRWWSELNQMKYVVEQQDALFKCLTEYENGRHENNILSISEIRTVKELLPLLKKMESFSNTLSIEHDISSSGILKSVSEITRLLNSHRLTSSDQVSLSFHLHMKKVGNILKSIYDTATDETSHIDMSQYMDPRFDKINCSNMDAIIRIDAAHINVVLPTNITQDNDKNPFSDLFDDEDICPTTMSLAAANPIEDEIARFRCEPRMPYSSNILEFWNSRKGVYPILSNIAKKYLCINASSVAVERLFSTSGRVMTKFRLSLNGEHSEQLIFIAKNHEKIPFQ